MMNKHANQPWINLWLPTLISKPTCAITGHRSPLDPTQRRPQISRNYVGFDLQLLNQNQAFILFFTTGFQKLILACIPINFKITKINDGTRHDINDLSNFRKLLYALITL